MSRILLTYEIVARQGEDGHEDGLVRLHLRQPDGCTRTEVHAVIDQLREVVRRMVPSKKSKPPKSLRDRVFRSCDRAVENGYVEDFEGSGESIYDCDPVVVAMDMLDTDEEFESLNTDDDSVRSELVGHVQAWQDARRPNDG